MAKVMFIERSFFSCTKIRFILILPNETHNLEKIDFFKVYVTRVCLQPICLNIQTDCLE